MPRNRIIETDELIALVDQYRLAHPDEKIKIPELGAFIRKIHPEVADRLIRRNEEVAKYIEEHNKGSLEAALQTVANFRSLDVDSFLKKNRTPENLRRALIERDDYYRRSMVAADKLYRQHRALKAELMDAQIRCEELEKAYAKLQQTKERKADKQSENTIRKLRKIIDTYVYPEIANELLRKEGLVEFVGNRLNTGAVEDDLALTGTDVAAKVDDIIAGMTEAAAASEKLAESGTVEKSADIIKPLRIVRQVRKVAA